MNQTQSLGLPLAFILSFSVIISSCSPNQKELMDAIGTENLIEDTNCINIPESSFLNLSPVDINTMTALVSQNMVSQFSVYDFNREDINELKEGFSKNIFTWKKPFSEALISFSDTSADKQLTQFYWESLMPLGFKGFYLKTTRFEYYLRPYICVQKINSKAGQIKVSSNVPVKLFPDKDETTYQAKVYHVYNVNIKMKILVNFVDLSDLSEKSNHLLIENLSTGLLYSDREL